MKQEKFVSLLLTVSLLISLLPIGYPKLVKAEEKNPLTIEKVYGLSTVPGTFRKSQSVAVAKDGTIFIADTGESQIEVYDSKFKYLRSFGSIGSRDSQFQSIQKIALDSDENLYVLDTYASIQVFTKEGKYLRKMGGTEDSFFPIDFAFLKTEELLIVTPDIQSRIITYKVFSKEGKYIRNFFTDKKYEKENLFFTELLVDSSGCVYSTFFNFDENEEGYPIGNEYFKFNPDGAFACEFIKKGSEDKDLANDIGFMSTEGNLFYLSDGSLIKKYEIQKDPKEPLKYLENFIIESDDPLHPLLIEYPSAGECSQQKLYMMDPSYNRLVVLSSTKTLLGTIQSPILEQGKMYPKDKIPTNIFSNPQGITVGSDGKYYVANSYLNKISIFDSTWKEINSIGKPPISRNKELGELSSPMDIAFDKQGNLFVVDTDSEEFSIDGSIEIFKEDSTPYHSIPIYTPNGAGIAFNSNGNLVVANDFSGIELFDTTKLTEKKLSKIKTFTVEGMGLNELLLDEDDNMIISHNFSMDIQWINPKGKVIRKISATEGGANPILFPKGMCLDGAGNLYVCEAYIGRIHKISPKGERIWTSDLGWRGLAYITMDSNGKLFVTDTDHNVVLQISDSTTIPPVPFVPKPIQTNAAFSLTPRIETIVEGDLFTIQAQVKKLENCASLTLSIRYPEELVSYQTAELGELWKGTDITLSEPILQPGMITITLDSPTKKEINKSGNILEINFIANKAGTGKLALETIAMKNAVDREVLFGTKTDLEITILSGDTTPPILTVKPVPESVYEPLLIIQGETEPEATVTVNQKEVPVKADGTFDTTLELVNGENTIQVIATDKAGNHSDITLKVVRKERIIIQLTVGSREIIIKGIPGILESEPFIDKSSGRTMVPLRAITTAIGASLSFDAKEQKITIVMEDTYVTLWIGKPIAKVNGAEKPIDETGQVTPVIVKGRTFLPLRFIAETFEFQVEWDPKTQGITLTYPKR